MAKKKTPIEPGNHLFYGDNLEILDRYIDDNSIDLIYSDPPFKSEQDYNVLFAERDGTSSAAQIRAFEDTWQWDQAADAAYIKTLNMGGNVAEAIKAMRRLLKDSDMMAYLVMMAPRIAELHRALKSTGTIYLHCDPTAAHYLKIVMDAIFGPTNFRNEIIWQRTIAKSLMTRKLPENHDTILCYQKTDKAVWNGEAMFTPYDEDNLDDKTKTKYCHEEADGRVYRLDNLMNPNPDRPNLTYEFLGITKVWRWTKDRMQAAYDAGLVVQTRPGAIPQLKRYLDEQRGRPIGDIWTDIPPLNSQAQERLGYPTQKPQALLERIIRASTKPDGVVLDAFCGCGTTIAAAQALGRRWVGIDITHLAISLIKSRLHLAANLEKDRDYTVTGEPIDVKGALALAEDDRFQFQSWALGLVYGRRTDPKHGADQGIDGKLFFHDEKDTRKTKTVIFSVKSGHVTSRDTRDLRGVLDRENAQIGVLITLQEPSAPMRSEAAKTGFYETPFGGTKYPRMQILTVQELLDGKRVEMPRQATVTTFRRPPKLKKDATHRQPKLDEFVNDD